MSQPVSSAPDPPRMDAGWHLREAQRLLSAASEPVSEQILRMLVLRADAHGKLAKRIQEVELMMNPPWTAGGGSAWGGGQGGGGGTGGSVHVHP